MDICFNLITHLSPTPSNYKTESMLNLEELLLLENTKLAFKMQHHLLPVRLHNMLNSDSRMKSLEKSHHYETRNKNIPKLPSAKTRHYHTIILFGLFQLFRRVLGSSQKYGLKPYITGS